MEIFGDGMSDDDKAKAMREDKSILDFSMAQVKSLKERLGKIEQDKLNSHLDALRELERQINTGSGQQCNPVFDDHGITFPDRDTKYPKTHHINDYYGHITDMMISIMVEALACGITRFGLFQFSHGVSPTQFNFAGGPGINMGHHDMSHYGGDANGEVAIKFKQSQRWHMLKIAEILQKLKDIPTSQGNLLDSSVILATTELGDSNLHNFKGVGAFLAGHGGGKINQGQVLGSDDSYTSYNQLLVSALRPFGLEDNTFGDPSLGQGPINGLIKN